MKKSSSFNLASLKLRVYVIDWEYPSEKKIPAAEVWDLAEQQELMNLYTTFANGILVEFKAIAQSDAALTVLRNIVTGAGGCSLALLTSSQKEETWLYESGYECFTQGVKEPAFIFLHPVPHPELFE